MISWLVIGVVLTVAVLVLIWYAISALVQLKKTLANVDELAVNLNTRLVPLVDDIQETVDRANTELKRVNHMVNTVEDIGAKVNAVTRVVNDLSSMLGKAAGFSKAVGLTRAISLSAGAKGALRKLVRR